MLLSDCYEREVYQPLTVQGLKGKTPFGIVVEEWLQHLYKHGPSGWQWPPREKLWTLINSSKVL